MKIGNIVQVCKENMCAPVGRICQISYVYPPRPKEPTRYAARFLSDGVGCAGVFYENEIRPAPKVSQKKYTQDVIQKMFGDCLKKGCSDECVHK